MASESVIAPESVMAPESVTESACGIETVGMGGNGLSVGETSNARNESGDLSIPNARGTLADRQGANVKPAKCSLR